MVDLNKIAKELKKEYSSVEVADKIEDPKDFVSTGNLAFDLISDGGIPFGYIAEFLGLSQSGKSLFVYQIIANAMKKYGSDGVLIDRENAYTKSRGAQLGIDNKKLLIAKPNDTPTPTDAFKFILASVEKIRDEDKESYIVVGIDSISAFGKDVAMEKSDAGRKAKMTHEGLREVLRVIDERVMLIICNQVTYKIGILYGDPRTTTAGESIKYYGNMRFALEDKRKIIDPKKGNEVVGNWLGIEAIKTRLGPCFRTCYLQHLYETGIDYHSGYLRLLSQRGYLKPKNKKDYWKFESVMLKDKDDNEVNENKTEAYLKKNPNMLFDKYPEYCTEEKPSADKGSKSVESKKKDKEVN